MFIFQLIFSITLFSCDLIEKNSQEISMNCFKALEKLHLNKNIVQELYVLGSYVKNDQPIITVEGFFPFNRKLLFSIVGTCAIYFIAVLQIQLAHGFS